MPEVVSNEELPSAAILSGLQLNISGIVGPALGGFFIPLVGANWLFTINACVFVVVILVLVLIAVLGGAVVIGLRARTGSAQEDPIISFLEKLFGDFTNVLGWVVIILAFLGIFLLCNAALSPNTDRDTIR